MGFVLLGILNSQVKAGSTQSYYVGISDFATGNRFAYAHTANNRLVGYALDGPSGDVGTIVQLDGSGAVLSATDIRTNVGGGDNRARVRVAETIGGVDYLAVTDEATGNSDSHAVKLAEDGTIEWGRYLGRGSGGSNNVAPYNITADSSGNVYMLVQDAAGDSIEIAKWNTSGSLQWKLAYKQASFAVDGRSGTISTDSSGNLYLITWITDSSGTAYGSLVLVAKLNPSNGAIVWQKYFEFPDDAPRGRGVVDADGNVYATCRAQIGPGFGENWALPLVKYDTDGNFEWETNLVVGTTDTVSDVFKPVIDSAGNVIVASNVGGVNGLLIASFDSSGSLNWQRIVTNSVNARPSMFSEAVLNIDSNDNVFLAGYWNDGTNIEQFMMAFPASGDFIGSYTDGTFTWTVAAGSAYDGGGFTARTPGASLGTATSALTEGATTLELFSRSFDLRVLVA